MKKWNYCRHFRSNVADTHSTPLSMSRRLWQQGGKGVVVPGCSVCRKRIKPLTLCITLTELWLWKPPDWGQDAGDGGGES